MLLHTEQRLQITPDSFLVLKERQICEEAVFFALAVEEGCQLDEVPLVGSQHAGMVLEGSKLCVRKPLQLTYCFWSRFTAWHHKLIHELCKPAQPLLLAKLQSPTFCQQHELSAAARHLQKAPYLSVKQLKGGNVRIFPALYALGIDQIHTVMPCKEHSDCLGQHSGAIGGRSQGLPCSLMLGHSGSLFVAGCNHSIQISF